MQNTNNSEILPRNRKDFQASGTQVRSFEELTRSGKRVSQKDKVLQIIQESGPISTRQIATRANFEIGACTRCISDLLTNIPSLIRIAHIDKSPLTGRSVQFYCDINWILKEGKQLALIQ